MYKLTTSTAILRIADNAYIPADEGNRDYQEYLQWVANGNTPDPIPELTLDEKVLAIEETYNVKFSTLQQRLSNVSLSDGLDQEAKTIIIQNEYKELSDQKDLEILELFGGV